MMMTGLTWVLTAVFLVCRVVCHQVFIGPDSVASHKKFQQKAGLPFPLLSDAKKEVAKAYHNIRVWHGTTLGGEEEEEEDHDDDVDDDALWCAVCCASQGRNVMRTTVLVDPKGKVVKMWQDIPESEVEANPLECLNFMKQVGRFTARPHHHRRHPHRRRRHQQQQQQQEHHHHRRHHHHHQVCCGMCGCVQMLGASKSGGKSATAST
jgi:hypothetical protein